VAHEGANESFAWLSKEIPAVGGEATLCESNLVGGTSDEAIEALFHAARGKEYQELAEELRTALKAVGRARRIDDARLATGESALLRFRRRMSEIAELDFFARPGREATISLLAAFEQRLREPDEEVPLAKKVTPRHVKGTVWVTARAYMSIGSRARRCSNGLSTDRLQIHPLPCRRTARGQPKRQCHGLAMSER
jgi:hypothetical protein